jgi:hypothetical protein
MPGLRKSQRAALLIAGAFLGIVFSGTVTALITRAHINQVRPLPPSRGEPAPDMRADAGRAAGGRPSRRA